MFEWFRKKFTPTIEKRIEKEVLLARKLANKTKRKMQEWAENPVGYNVMIFVGTLNNREKDHLESMIKDEICQKYECKYYFTNNVWLAIDACYNTSWLILQERGA